jgi:hypothetical protein
VEILSDALAESRREVAALKAVQEPLEYWNAVEGWVKIDEVREHFDSVGCGTIYKTAGDGRVPLTAAQRQWDYDTLHAAWHAVGADVAGLKWETFVAKLKEKNA